MLQLLVAEKLGYTLGEIQERLTPQELAIWSAFYTLRKQEEDAAMEKAKKRRR
jgi:hypothetical protein